MAIQGAEEEPEVHGRVGGGSGAWNGLQAHGIAGVTSMDALCSGGGMGHGHAVHWGAVVGTNSGRWGAHDAVGGKTFMGCVVHGACNSQLLRSWIALT